MLEHLDDPTPPTPTARELAIVLGRSAKLRRRRAASVLTVLGVVALVRYLGHNHDTPTGPASGPASIGESILRERLARGEIDEEQFRKTLSLLRGS